MYRRNHSNNDAWKKAQWRRKEALLRCQKRGVSFGARRPGGGLGWGWRGARGEEGCCRGGRLPCDREGMRGKEETVGPAAPRRRETPRGTAKTMWLQAQVTADGRARRIT